MLIKHFHQAFYFSLMIDLTIPSVWRMILNSNQLCSWGKTQGKHKEKKALALGPAWSPEKREERGSFYRGRTPLMCSWPRLSLLWDTLFQVDQEQILHPPPRWKQCSFPFPAYIVIEVLENKMAEGKLKLNETCFRFVLACLHRVLIHIIRL